MMNFALIIAVSLLALVFFLWLALRRSASESALHHDHPVNSSDHLVRLPPRALLDRFLSPEDVEYAATLNSPAVLRLVVGERRRLAAAWLRQTRREAGRLFRLHIRMVRQAEGLRPAAEVKLVFAAGSFLVVYAVMMTAVGLYGPFQTRRGLESLQSLANVLSNLGGRIADSISPALVQQMDAQGGR
jgi:hypothetical protein